MRTDPTVSPRRITANLKPEESCTTQIQIGTGDVPFGKGDIMFVFDRTASMGAEIDQAKSSAIDMMGDIRAELPNAWFGVASFMDYPDYYTYPGYENYYGTSDFGDVPWVRNLQPTESTTAVSQAINALTLGNGMDIPEDYTRALYEIAQIGEIGWRPTAKKIAVLFGDAPTHDLNFAGYNYGGDPGRDGIAQTADDLNFESVVSLVAEREISVIAVDSSGGYDDTVATFKGMSTGFAGAGGTNGLYFSLNDAADIPLAVTNLIISETKKIDNLSIQPTAGFAPWVKATPTEYQDVPANQTRVFEITLTVPKDTEAGFYPFVIQAIGDSNTLGLTYVEITVPGDSPSDDTGFRPNPDGFGFENTSSQATWDMFKQFFGSENVQYADGTRIHAADEFFSDPDNGYANVGSGGSCFGFSTASLINYDDLPEPVAGQYSIPSYTSLFSTKTNDDLKEAYTYYQGVQMGREIASFNTTMCDLLDNSPKAYFNYLKSLIQNGEGAILGFSFQVSGNTYGHAVVAYRYEEESADKAYVYIYDNNKPDQERRFEFDLKENRWKYRMHVPFWFDTEVSGDSSGCNLRVRPVEMTLHQGIPWWTVPDDLRGLETATIDLGAQLIVADGPIGLLFTDDEGRRLGWSEGEFFDEIPGAALVPTEDGKVSKPANSYYLPGNAIFDLQISGQGEGAGGVGIWTDGSFAALTNLELGENETMGLRVSDDGGRVSLAGSSAATAGTLTVSRILDDQDHTATIRGISMNPGDEVALSLAVNAGAVVSDTITVEANASTSLPLDISIHKGGAGGYEVFGHEGIPIPSDSLTRITVEDWSNVDQASVEVDEGNDGSVDDSFLVDNETSVGSLKFEPATSDVLAGGEPVELVVQVRDQFGAYVVDGTEIELSTTLGQLSPAMGTTVGGLVNFSFIPGAKAGEARITATVNGIEETLIISIHSRDLYLPAIFQ